MSGWITVARRLFGRGVFNCGSYPKADSFRRVKVSSTGNVPIVIRTNLHTNHPPQIANTTTKTMMTDILNASACRACAIAKRRCGKQKPLCLRCRTRNIDCMYPPTKPTSFVPCGGDGTFLAGHDVLTSNTPRLSTCSLGLQNWAADDARASPGLELSGVSLGTFGSQPDSWWFASTKTWEIDHGPLAVRTRFPSKDLKRVMAKIHRWLAQYVDEGSNLLFILNCIDIGFPGVSRMRIRLCHVIFIGQRQMSRLFLKLLRTHLGIS